MGRIFVTIKDTFNKDRTGIILLICISIIFLAIQMCYYYSRAGGWEIFFCDTDPHMRLVRVEQLAATGDWYDNVIHRSNAPYGETLHWTRPLDVLLLLGAWLLKPFLGFHNALGWWGVVISPILGVLSLIALYWATKPALKENARRLLVLLYLAQPLMALAFTMGRADHHSLLALNFILLLGCLYRMITVREDSLKLSLLAGLLAGIGVWISVEFLVAVFWVISTLTLLWIFRARNYSRCLLHFSLVLLISTCVFLLVERPVADILIMEYDRISIVHVFIFVVVAACSLAMTRVYGRSNLQRLMTAGLAGLGGFMLILCFLPDFLHGPFSQVDATVARIWLSLVREVQPVLKAGLIVQLLFVGPLFFSLFYLLWAAVRIRDDHFRSCLVPLLVGLPLFAGLTFYQLRWIYYSNVFIIICLSLLLNQLLGVLSGIRSSFAQRLGRVLLILLFCCGFYTAGILAEKYHGDQNESSYEANLRPLCKWLNSLPDSTIFIDLDFAPEILYRTGHKVIATPYHRNAAGILYSYELMGTHDMGKVHDMLKDRNVDLVILCPQSSERVFFRTETDAGISFYGRLLAGDIPDWLDTVELPENLQEDYLVFEVHQ